MLTDTIIFLKMNKLIFSLFLGLLFTACQNTPPNAAESAPAPAPAPEAPALASPESIQQASEGLNSGIKLMESLRQRVDALPAKVKKDKAAEIEGFYSNFEGMIEKQTGMLNELKAATAPQAESATQESAVPAAILNAAQIQDFNESAARYAKEAQAMQEAISKLEGGK